MAVRQILFFSIFALAAGACATGADRQSASVASLSTADEPSTTLVDAGGNRVKCKQIAEPGSRLGGRKVCMREAEWHRLEEETARDFMRERDSRAAAHDHG